MNAGAINGQSATDCQSSALPAELRPRRSSQVISPLPTARRGSEAGGAASGETPIATVPRRQLREHRRYDRAVNNEDR